MIILLLIFHDYLPAVHADMGGGKIGHAGDHKIVLQQGHAPLPFPQEGASLLRAPDQRLPAAEPPRLHFLPARRAVQKNAPLSQIGTRFRPRIPFLKREPSRCWRLRRQLRSPSGRTNCGSRLKAKKKPVRHMEKALKAFSIAFRAFSELARKEGFEPSHVVWTSTPLAGEPLRPLGYFRIGRMKYIYGLKNGGESGIRTHGCSRIAGFQDRFLKPLGHLSQSVLGAGLILPRLSQFVNG